MCSDGELYWKPEDARRLPGYGTEVGHEAEDPLGLLAFRGMGSPFLSTGVPGTGRGLEAVWAGGAEEGGGWT